MYYSVSDTSYSEKTSKFPKRSRTYDLPHTGRMLYHWAVGDIGSIPAGVTRNLFPSSLCHWLNNIFLIFLPRSLKCTIIYFHNIIYLTTHPYVFALQQSLLNKLVCSISVRSSPRYSFCLTVLRLSAVSFKPNFFQVSLHNCF